MQTLANVNHEVICCDLGAMVWTFWKEAQMIAATTIDQLAASIKKRAQGALFYCGGRALATTLNRLLHRPSFAGDYRARCFGTALDVHHTARLGRFAYLTYRRWPTHVEHLSGAC